MKRQERQRQVLRINDLQKVYANGHKAVDGLSVKMYPGQIFALLGHNGAGKTTTLKMLTGMLEPTDGDMTLFGRDMVLERNEVALNLGICPQDNVLYDLLTVEEHMQLYCDLKGIEEEPQLNKDIEDPKKPKS
jgi:ATP-binding cassette subfamily A (ABC1) protein 3